MKVTTEQCKQYIVDWCASHPLDVNRELSRLGSVDPKHVSNIRRWKRDYKQFNGRLMERRFACVPYDMPNGSAGLMAYVYSDPQDTRILRLRLLSNESLTDWVEANTSCSVRDY